MEKYALVSVSEKEGIVDLCRKLEETNYTIISTGGTFKLLKENNIKAIEISEFTGENEILGGRVKTLGRVVHAGLLADPNLHEDEIGSIKQISVVVCNFYPFEKKVSEAMQKIDQGEKAEKIIT